MRGQPPRPPAGQFSLPTFSFTPSEHPLTTRSQTIASAIELRATPEVADARRALALLPPPLAGEEEVVRRLRENLRDALDGLDGLASGNIERNAQTRLKAIELLLRYSQPLPKQQVEHSGVVGCMVVDPYAVAPETVDALPPGPEGQARQLVVARAPRIRKKAVATSQPLGPAAAPSPADASAAAGARPSAASPTPEAA